jgi:hypothetical protein
LCGAGSRSATPVSTSKDFGLMNAYLTIFLYNIETASKA